jgi:hypothetical protein
VQNIGEDGAENNWVPENGNTSDKVTFANSNNDEISVNMIKAAVTIVTQWLY